MVRLCTARSLLFDESGMSLIEGLIVFPLVVLVFAAFVEFGYAMFQWSATAKAVQYGARLAAVSDPVLTGADLTNFLNSATPADPTQVGDSMPAGTTWSCSGSPSDGGTCSASLNRIVYGNTTATGCQPVGTAGVRLAMCQLNPRIQPNNVTVSYTLSGLGYYGRPEGAVVTVRVSVHDITFDLPIIGALLGLKSVTVPAMPVTVTSEDLSTTSS